MFPVGFLLPLVGLDVRGRGVYYSFEGRIRDLGYFGNSLGIFGIFRDFPEKCTEFYHFTEQREEGADLVDDLPSYQSMC